MKFILLINLLIIHYYKLILQKEFNSFKTFQILLMLKIHIFLQIILFLLQLLHKLHIKMVIITFIFYMNLTFINPIN